MVTLHIKDLVYQRLQPYAKLLDAQLLVVDYATYKTWDKSLWSKAASFGIDDNSFGDLLDAVRDYSCLALLKSYTYLEDSKIASAFAKVGLKASDISLFKTRSVRDSGKDIFIYWFPVDVQSFGGNVVNEDVEELEGMYGSKVKRITPASLHGINGLITVNDLVEAIDNAWPGQEDAVFNFGPNSYIYGQVNQAFDENGACILGLAPYKNGRRSRDLSINGVRDAALTFKQLKPILLKMSPDAAVFIRMKDPTGFGPNAGRIIQQPANYIDVDNKWGVFIRTDDKHKEVVG